MAIRGLSPLDAAWLALESRETPAHVGALLEFTVPEGAGPGYVGEQVQSMRASRDIAAPWNLSLVEAPLVGSRLPLMREERDVDLDYHVRHAALPHPGGQRELGVLISRLHSHQLDLRRPLWEVYVIEGLEDNRFAIYVKMHHSLIDGVSGMRLILRALSTDPAERGMPGFWNVSPRRRGGGRQGRDPGPGALGRLARAAPAGVEAAAGLGRATLDLGRAVIDGRPLRAPYLIPDSALQGPIAGQRRFATQQYDLDRIKGLATAGECTVNDIVLYLTATALRSYLAEHARLPSRGLTAGIPVNLREPGDEGTGTMIGMMVVELGTDVADPLVRLEAIKLSAADAKQHLRGLPKSAQVSYPLVLNGPYITGLLAGLRGRVPVPFNVAISNVPGPPETLYLNGARLDAIFPLSLLLHGNALNVTCVSYAGTLNFGFTGARDSLPHLQRLAVYMGEALEEISAVLAGEDSPVPARA